MVCFSGPHGAGKSTFMHALLQQHPERFVLYPDRLSFARSNEPFLRNRAKLVKYFHEWIDQQEFLKEYPDKTVFVDRCVYDGMVYTKAYADIGWIVPEEYLLLEQFRKQLFCAEPHYNAMPSHLVVLVPPLDAIVTRLERRWTTKGKKWREEDKTYLAAAHDGFSHMERIFTGTSLLKLDKDLSLEEEMQQFMTWMEQVQDKGQQSKAVPETCIPELAYSCIPLAVNYK
ncbi:MAG: deoxynucleoside kinase [archaeon]